jgi:hypothetical protein
MQYILYLYLRMFNNSIFTFERSIPLQTVKHKIGEKYSQAQQYISQLYNRCRMLVFLRHVSTHFLSHPQALHNVRLITVKYLRKCVRDLIFIRFQLFLKYILSVLFRQTDTVSRSDLGRTL